MYKLNIHVHVSTIHTFITLELEYKLGSSGALMERKVVQGWEMETLTER